ncbi:hypothetical protein AAKU55_005842 [Oxalobacteraceae bacterium GrIS 1.11]
MAIDWDKLVSGPVMAVFGEAARFLPVAGAPFDIQGAFHEAYKSVDLVGGMGMTSEMPALGVRLADFPARPLQKDRVTIAATGLHGGGTYVVKEVQPNGIGGAVLLLNRMGD